MQAWRGVASNLEARGIKPISADALLLASVLDENQKRALRVRQGWRRSARVGVRGIEAFDESLLSFGLCRVVVPKVQDHQKALQSKAVARDLQVRRRHQRGGVELSW